MTNFNNDIFAEVRKECRKTVLQYLEDGNIFYLCDMHNHIFNEEEFYIYYSDARDFFKENEKDFDVFEVIEKIVKYEKDNFGEVNTDFSNPCNVVNMLFYIIGQEEIYSMFDGCEEFDIFWNEEIGDTECKVLVAWLKDNERV